MISSPSDQAFFSGPGGPGLLLPNVYHHPNGRSFSVTMDEPSSWIQSISDFEDQGFLEAPAFAEAEEGARQRPRSDDRRVTQPGSIGWLEGNGAEIYQPLQTVSGYGQVVGAPPWANGDPSALVGSPGVSFYNYSIWCQEAYSQNQLTVPPGAFGAASFSSHWSSSNCCPGEIMGAAPLLLTPQGVPHFGAPGPGSGAIWYEETQSPGGQARNWPSGAVDSYVLPQAVYRDPPPVPSVASSPSLGDLSSAASIADASDMSDVCMRPGVSIKSPCGSSPAASGSAASGAPDPASNGRARAPATRGRARRSRRRLPSTAPDASPDLSSGSPAAQRPTRRAHREHRDASPSAQLVSLYGGSSTGKPYYRILEMDPASRAILERTLIRDRHPSRAVKVPYKAIMAKVKHLFVGAEETLRGHYRRITKPPQDRVRRPVWHSIDVHLLRKAVPQCRKANGRISWTGVSKYISDHGGSYNFGITTCSRKWEALQAEDAQAG